jgi:hypothetical protein
MATRAAQWQGEGIMENLCIVVERHMRGAEDRR